MNSLVEKQIKKFIEPKSIKKRTLLSEAFNMKCEKIDLNNNEVFVAKYYINKNNNFNSINSEANSLIYLSKKFPLLFPSIKYQSKDMIIIDYILHNNIKNNDYQFILAKNILKLHKITNEKYGFEFDSQIGGLKQPNNFNSNWVDFYTNQRIYMIFDKINKSKPMPKSINQTIEKLMKNMRNFIPNSPNVSLLHGDLWEGNILFNDGKLAGLIDPGIYFGHNELEIAYLTWFKFIDENFLDFYSNILKIDKYFIEYEPIYQLYYSLLNVQLWDRKYISDVEKLLKKTKI